MKYSRRELMHLHTELEDEFSDLCNVRAARSRPTVDCLSTPCEGCRDRAICDALDLIDGDLDNLRLNMQVVYNTRHLLRGKQIGYRDLVEMVAGLPVTKVWRV